MKVKKCIFNIMKISMGFLIGIISESRLHILNKNHKISDNNKYIKFKQYYNILNQWIWLKHNNISIESIFLKAGYKSVAIYGMGEIGWRLFEELENTDVSVLYGIDNSLSESDNELIIVTPEDNLQQVDAIIVSSVFAFEEIREKLNMVTDIPIISLEDLLFKYN